MNEQHLELTSALLDGELDRDTQSRVVSAMLDGGSEALGRFGRYRLIGDVMRGEADLPAHTLVDRVHDALRDEPVVLAPPRRRPAAWLKPAAGLAVAASVAAVAVVVAPQLMGQGETGSQQVQLAADLPRPMATPVLVAAAGPTAAEPQVPQVAGHWQAIDQRLEDRLNRMVIEHNEFGGRTGINGPVPHIGFVSYGGR